MHAKALQNSECCVTPHALHSIPLGHLLAVWQCLLSTYFQVSVHLYILGRMINALTWGLHCLMRLRMRLSDYQCSKHHGAEQGLSCLDGHQADWGVCRLLPDPILIFACALDAVSPLMPQGEDCSCPGVSGSVRDGSICTGILAGREMVYPCSMRWLVYVFIIGLSWLLRHHPSGSHVDCLAEESFCTGDHHVQHCLIPIASRLMHCAGYHTGGNKLYISRYSVSVRLAELDNAQQGFARQCHHVGMRISSSPTCSS